MDLVVPDISSVVLLLTPIIRTAVTRLDGAPARKTSQVGTMNDKEKLLYGLFLNSGVRDAEMQNTEYADFNWEKCTLHVQPKPWRKFRLKGKSKKKCAKGRFIPIPAKLVWKIKDRMRERDAQPHDLVFPNGEGKPDGHFLRKLKAIAKKAGVEGQSFTVSERPTPTRCTKRAFR
jgi:integrase